MRSATCGVVYSGQVSVARRKDEKTTRKKDKDVKKERKTERKKDALNLTKEGKERAVQLAGGVRIEAKVVLDDELQLSVRIATNNRATARTTSAARAAAAHGGVLNESEQVKDARRSESSQIREPDSHQM